MGMSRGSTTIFTSTTTDPQPSGGGGGGGVTDLNSLTGSVVIAAGTNITLNTVGNTITINASGGSAPVYPLNQIVFGDGVTPGGITDPNLTHDPVGNNTIIQTPVVSNASTFSVFASNDISLGGTTSDLAGRGSDSAKQMLAHTLFQWVLAMDQFRFIRLLGLMLHTTAEAR